LKTLHPWFSITTRFLRDFCQIAFRAKLVFPDFFRCKTPFDRAVFGKIRNFGNCAKHANLGRNLMKPAVQGMCRMGSFVFATLVPRAEVLTRQLQDVQMRCCFGTHLACTPSMVCVPAFDGNPFRTSPSPIPAPVRAECVLVRHLQLTIAGFPLASTSRWVVTKGFFVRKAPGKL
jgi:hypothetical protein